MKLINKRNPEIRITAPEIEVHEEEQMCLIPVSDYCIPLCIVCIGDWTLVEEEPVKEEICSKCIHDGKDDDYCRNLHGKRWINGNGLYKCTEFCDKEQEEPKVDFEKLTLERWPVVMVPKDPWDVDEDGSEEDLNEFDRDAYLQGLKEGYELGLKARKEE